MPGVTTRFEGRRALVTGAAGGIGRAMVDLFAEEGATVVGVDLREADGVRSCDVSDPDSANAAVAAAAAELGGLDVLVNVAGIDQFRRFEDLDVATWQRHLGVNLTGPMLMSHAALPHLRASRGNIVTIASIAGLRAQPYQAAYCASKGGVIMLMKSLALELATDGIRVNTVCPGGVETDLPMAAAAEHGLDSDLDWGLLTETAGGRYGFMPPRDIAEAVAYLASDAAASVTGAVLSVDRGTAC
jgi:NAD(P)-dependent dehydrogenase (short-subunit alcohol dehydrogenase family)